MTNRIDIESHEIEGFVSQRYNDVVCQGNSTLWSVKVKDSGDRMEVESSMYHVSAVCCYRSVNLVTFSVFTSFLQGTQHC